MSLLAYIIRRLLLMIVVLFGVTLIVFSILMILPPGMRVAAFVKSSKVTPQQMEAMIHKYGMDQPAPVQYLHWIESMAQGNFGYSSVAQEPVLKAFTQYFPVTLELVLYAVPLIIFVGIVLGTIGAVHKDRPADHFTRVFAIIGYSLPTFWLGLILMMFFYGYVGIFPPGLLSNEMSDLVHSASFHRYTGLLTIDGILNWRWDVVVSALYHLFLPVFNLVLLSSALIMRLMRSTMLEALGQDYIRTALAKGADRRTIIRKHARRNALIPVVTISGVLFAGLMGGAVITETIFNRPGIGLWTAQAAILLDVPAVMFNVLFLGVVFVFVNLVVDIIYAYLDPRIRLG
ncbi:MAG TPA: ABC transporter permease [Spirochaetia bacterium]|nr:ABC transporter permease [Spirochaetia bacterium]